MTPDDVETRVGAPEFFDGIPTEQTAALLFDIWIIFVALKPF